MKMENNENQVIATNKQLVEFIEQLPYRHLAKEIVLMCVTKSTFGYTIRWGEVRRICHQNIDIIKEVREIVYQLGEYFEGFEFQQCIHMWHGKTSKHEFKYNILLKRKLNYTIELSHKGQKVYNKFFRIDKQLHHLFSHAVFKLKSAIVSVKNTAKITIQGTNNTFKKIKHKFTDLKNLMNKPRLRYFNVKEWDPNYNPPDISTTQLEQFRQYIEPYTKEKYIKSHGDWIPVRSLA